MCEKILGEFPRGVQLPTQMQGKKVLQGIISIEELEAIISENIQHFKSEMTHGLGDKCS